MISEKMFLTFKIQSTVFKDTSDNKADRLFWDGYQRGINFLRYERKSGTFSPSEEHIKRFSIPQDHNDLTIRAYGEGYRHGVRNVSPVWLYNHIHSEYLTTTQLAEKTNSEPSRIRKLAKRIPGGRFTKQGWLFPPESINFINSLPGRGRPKKGGPK